MLECVGEYFLNQWRLKRERYSVLHFAIGRRTTPGWSFAVMGIRSKSE